MASRPVNAEVSSLVGLFYSSADEVGEFEKVSVEEMPAAYRRLLAHDQHMTVTIEEFHGGAVDVNVLKVMTSANHYARRILLTRQSDGQVVQFGIVRLSFDFLDAPVRREIESRSTPLGRILIEHNVMREIELLDLWRVRVGPELRRLFAVAPTKTTYGRTAIIHCNGQPAVELLEIVAPVE